MTPLDWIAGAALFFLLPIPLFWLILHPFAGFWRRRYRAAFWTAGLMAWGAGGTYIGVLSERLLQSGGFTWQAATGMALVIADFAMLAYVTRVLGHERLTGKTELSGGGELMTSGIYSRIRHPRYTAMMGAMLGVCLIGDSAALWLTAAAWLLLVMLAIHFEERELRARFGASYEEYRRRVPAFFPQLARGRRA